MFQGVTRVGRVVSAGRRGVAWVVAMLRLAPSPPTAPPVSPTLASSPDPALPDPVHVVSTEHSASLSPTAPDHPDSDVTKDQVKNVDQDVSTSCLSLKHQSEGSCETAAVSSQLDHSKSADVSDLKSELKEVQPELSISSSSHLYPILHDSTDDPIPNSSLQRSCSERRRSNVKMGENSLYEEMHRSYSLSRKRMKVQRQIEAELNDSPGWRQSEERRYSTPPMPGVHPYYAPFWDWPPD